MAWSDYTSLQLPPNSTGEKLFARKDSVTNALLQGLVLYDLNGNSLLGQKAMSASLPVTLASDQSALTVQAGLQTVATGTFTSGSSIPSYVPSSTGLDVSNSGMCSVSFNGTYGANAVINFEVSDDAGTTWYSVQGVDSGAFVAATSVALASNASRMFDIPLLGVNRIRMRLSVVPASGTINVRITPGTFATDPSPTVAIQSGTITANLNPLATTGWSFQRYSAQTTTVQTLKGSQGVIGGWYIYNPNTSVAYVQIFNTTGAVTLGTTAPDLTLGIPASAGANVEFTQGIMLTNGIKLAATTTPTGSTAPSTGLEINMFYK